MKHILSIFALTLTLSNITAQQTVAVLDFEGIGVSEDETRALSGRFANEFMGLSSGRYVIVERQQMGEILKEQGFQQSGCVSSECAVEVGAALGAKFIVIGSISKVGSLFSVNARLLDVETSQIIRSISHDQMGDIMLLMTQGLKEAAAKLLTVGVTKEPVVTTGSLRLNSLFPGVKLYDADTGDYVIDAPITPAVVEDLPAGLHKLRAEKEGYVSQIFEVEVFAGGESRLTITGLKKSTGQNITSAVKASSDPVVDGDVLNDPAWANVPLKGDRVSVGNAPGGPG